jgi:hypothetical protein
MFIKGTILFIIYLFIDSSLLNKDYNLDNKMYNNKSVVCNNIFLNITPITNKNLLKNCNYIYKKDIIINNRFNYILNKLLVFLGHIIIIFTYINNQKIQNKSLILNKITKKINFDNNFDECSICYTDYKFYTTIRKIIKCSHIYHEDCIKQWIIEYDNKTCPLCRCNVFE